jgi:surface antigen
VTWTNEASGLRYELSPGADRPRNGQTCREYTLVTTTDRRDRTSHTGLACRSAAGVWQVAQ